MMNAGRITPAPAENFSSAAPKIASVSAWHNTSPSEWPASPRGEPCESVISAQPTAPSSVVALRKIQGRQPASQ